MSDKPITDRQDEENRRRQLQAWIDKKFGGKQVDFIKAIQGNQGEISALLRGARVFGERKARSIEEAANMPPKYLEQTVPHEGMKQFGNANSVFGEGSNVVPIDMEKLGDPVPFITLKQAASWNDIPAPYDPNISDHWLPCPAPHGPRTYYTAISGDSMINPGDGPSYKPGDLVFVDPDRQAESGNYVIAIFDGATEPVLRQYTKDGGHKYLKTLNPAFQPTYTIADEKVRVLGVVIAKLLMLI